MSPEPRKYLIGVGNETMTDDGIGPRVADALVEEARARGFRTDVVGHDTASILSYFDDSTDRILFVDCVRMGRAPGDWVCFTPDDVETHKEVGRMTTHEGDLLKIVELGRQLGCPIPPITILGIEPARLEPGLQLSDTLRARFREYVAAAIAEMDAK